MARIQGPLILIFLVVGCSESKLEAEYNLTLQDLKKKQVQTQKQFNEDAIRQLEKMRANAEAMNETMLTEALEIAKAKGQVEVDAFLSQRQEEIGQLQQEVDSRQKLHKELIAEIAFLKKRLREIERRLGRKPSEATAIDND